MKQAMFAARADPHRVVAVFLRGGCRLRARHDANLAASQVYSLGGQCFTIASAAVFSEAMSAMIATRLSRSSSSRPAVPP